MGRGEEGGRGGGEARGGRRRSTSFLLRPRLERAGRRGRRREKMLPQSPAMGEPRRQAPFAAEASKEKKKKRK